MSVINQMLKELEQRQDEQAAGSSQSNPMQIQSKFPVKFTIAIVIIFLLLLNVLGIYIWSLYTENETLKSSVAKPIVQTAKLTNDFTKTEKTEKTEKIKQDKSVERHEPNIDKNTSKSLQVNNDPLISKIDAHNSNEKVYEVEQPKAYIKSKASLTKNSIQHNQNKLKNSVVTPLNKEVISDKTVEEVPKSSLSISRSQLSPERAVKKKFEQAERAIMDNDVPKAEKLFEDILLIQPAHKGARKQLSALWFGRKLLRPALNLLSKGIELYPFDVDFRLMKARLLLSQNNNKAAFDVLNGYAKVQHVEYQALLASTADSLGNIKSVILAYTQLVHIEEHNSKWWLGLAVALDRDSQFDEAKTAYKTALSKGSLSSNSAQFVRQRMIELGE